MNKHQWIQQLNLEPHIEGGYFKRTYQSKQRFDKTSTQSRPLMSSIYYLLTDDSPIGHFHKNQSDIMHYWHAGESLTYYLINPEGELTHHQLGPDASKGESLQLIVPGGYWKATELKQGEYGLLSEAVSPGFDYQDMMLANADEMAHHYPHLWPQIQRLCRS
ncbi:cupin domain-containing protein [Pleionea sp. CnH1-48]|uniref:cupin domain-containing protein n=1 Tax=Pleionea sp. CnH1-48 TaxID=2954494 RepID=UPI002096994E|nr:cupin domain-containing protein [Pleionea sp. CnH1-48]MCO7227251.1 cupin domain-containing protein [Pleionea sp. CnH1-48]